MKTFKIYWQVETDQGKKRGSDTITVDDDLFDEGDAESLLEDCANGDNESGSKYPELKNFSDYYVNAIFCRDFNLIKIKEIKPTKKAVAR